MRQRVRAVALGATLLVAMARPVAAGELTVSAAASLTAAFGEIAAAFEDANPGTDVRLNFAGSPALVQQILEGAPVDVFAAADERSMERVVAAGEAAGAPRVFARNRLGILVERGNPKGIGGLADL